MLVLSRGRSQEGRDFGRILSHRNARIREGLHLRFGRPFARLDDRPRVPHPFSRRRAATGDVGHHRLRDLPSDEIGRFFLGRPADLPHEHNALRRTILLEPGEGLHHARADDRVASDPDARRLAEARLGHRVHDFVGQGAASTAASFAYGAGTKSIDAFAFRFRTASATRSNTGTPSTLVPAFPGVTPATTFVPKSSIARVWNWP